MNSKERVQMCLNHEEPDRVPVHCWYNPQVATKLKDILKIKHNRDPRKVYTLDVEIGSDLLYTRIGSINGQDVFYWPKHEDIDTYVCDWGITWKKVYYKGGYSGEIVKNPLAGDISKLNSYNTPDPYSEKNYIVVREIVKKYGKTHAIVGYIGSTIFETSWFLRGLEQFLVDLIKNEDFANTLMDKVMSYSLVVGKKLVEIGVDIIWLADDIGTQNSMLISPELYRRYLKPRYAKFIKELKKINPHLKIAYHTDGFVEPVIQDFIEIGIDILHPVQPACMNPKKLKEKYGNKLSFWGTVDVQQVMQFGGTREVVQEVKERIKTMAPGGGFILSSSHYIQPSKRDIDNIFTFYWTANRYGKYPIKI
jgi:uroporphyrinogen decarboxylase